MDDEKVSGQHRGWRRFGRWRSEGAMIAVFVMLCCLLGSIHGSEGKLVFLKRLHPVRVHEDAPAELYVTTVQAWNDNGTTTGSSSTSPSPWPTSTSTSTQSAGGRERIKYTLLKGSEFRVDSDTGQVLTGRRLTNARLNHVYTLLLAAAAGGMTETSEVPVHVTRFNRFGPHFRLADYRVEVARNLAVGESVLTVDALDGDPEPYNAEVYYFVDGDRRAAEVDRHDALLPSRDQGTPLVIQLGCYEFDVESALSTVSNSSEFFPPADEQCVAIDSGAGAMPFFRIDARSGVVRLRRRLTRDVHRLTVRVVAVDGGSPPRWNVTNVDVHVKGTTQPTEILVVNVTEFQARLCWRRPQDGVVVGYLVRYRTDAENEFTLNVTLEAGAEERPCVQLQQLQPGKRYELRVYGWNPEEQGIGSDIVHFTTLTPKCRSDDICGNGTCHAHVTNVHSEPQLIYKCECHPGFYGVDCRYFDPCALANPCRNAGTCRNSSSGHYVCACVQGFSGPDCSEFNPCDSSPDFIRCDNGGTCLSTASHAYTCSCPAGYHGERCERRDPCGTEPPPCRHDGVCTNRSDDSYECTCPPGFVGKNCEVDVDHCSSSPCVNGICVDGITNFTCICNSGFSGPLCSENVDECTTNPCLNEGRCNDGINAFTCSCLSGFEGRLCEINVDDCLSTPCYNGGSCTDDRASFFCTCTAAFQGPTCQTPAMCQEVNVTSAKGQLMFAATPHGTLASDDCPYGPIGEVATRKCVIGSAGLPEWEDVNITQCIDMAHMNAETITKRLMNMTAHPSKLTPEEIEDATDQIESILSIAIVEPSIAKDMISVISKLLDANETAFSPSKTSNHSAASRLISIVDQFVTEVKMDDTFDIQTDNLAVHVDKVNLNLVTMLPTAVGREWNTTTAMLDNSIDEEENDDTSYQTFPRIVESRSMLSETSSKENDSVPLVAISNKVFRKALSQCEQDSIKTRRMHYVAYKNAKMFKETHDITESPKTLDRLTPSDRWVLSISLENVSISNVTNGVNFTMKKSMMGPWICVFWDENNVHGARWSTRGIITQQSDTEINCSSNHMTAFSVLVDPTPGNVDPVHQKSLSIISYIGCGLSVIGLSLTILTYSLFRCLNRDKPGKILLNLCVALLLLNISFLTGSLRSTELLEINGQVHPTEPPGSEGDTPSEAHVAPVTDGLCTSVAILVHYFLLCSLSWMTVEAVNMYQLLIHVFATAEIHFLLKRCIVAWGVPMIIVGVTAAVNIDYYSFNDDNCMLSAANPYVYYFTFLGPCCVLIIINTTVFVMVVRVLMKPRGSGTTATSSGKVSAVGSATSPAKKGDGFRLDRVTFAQVRGAFTVMTLLGVSWVFGALAIGPARVLFQYVFCVLNSLQGFLVFVVRCLQYPEARAAWLQLIRTGTRKRTRGVTSRAATSSSTNSQARLSLSNGQHQRGNRSTTRSTSDGYENSGGGRRHQPKRQKPAALNDDIPVNMSGKVFWNRVKHHSIPVGTGTSASSWVYGGSGRGEKKSSPTTIAISPVITATMTENSADVEVLPVAVAKRRSSQFHLPGTKLVSSVGGASTYNGEPVDTKEGRDTQWLYLPINGNTTTGGGSVNLEKTAWLLESAPVRLSKVVAVDELPFIEDETGKSAGATVVEEAVHVPDSNGGLECQQMARVRGSRGSAAGGSTVATHQSDQGYSSAEPSPTAKRDLLPHSQVEGTSEVNGEVETTPFALRQRSLDHHTPELDTVTGDSILSDNAFAASPQSDRSSSVSNA